MSLPAPLSSWQNKRAVVRIEKAVLWKRVPETWGKSKLREYLHCSLPSSSFRLTLVRQLIEIKKASLNERLVFGYHRSATNI
jgi:hypothetical protein